MEIFPALASHSHRDRDASYDLVSARKDEGVDGTGRINVADIVWLFNHL